MRPAHILFILLIDVVWAFNAVAIKYAVLDIAPLAMVVVRYAMVFCCCLPWLRVIPGHMPLLLSAGFIAGALGMGLGAISYHVADNVSALAVAGQMGVPFTLLLAVLFLKERIRLWRVLAVLLCFIGVVIVSFDPAIVHERLGIMLTVGSALCWAVSAMFFRRLQGVTALNIHGWAAAVSIMPLVGASLIFEPGALASVGNLSLSAWGWIGYQAFLSTLVGHVGFAWLIQRYPVSTVSPLTLPTPILAMLLASWIFDIRLTPVMILGSVLLLLGVTIITLRTRSVQLGENL